MQSAKCTVNRESKLESRGLKLDLALYTMHSSLTQKDTPMAKINKEMTFNDVLRKYPDTVKVLKKYGMSCFGCLGAEVESLEDGAAAHGVDLDYLLKDLNKALKK